MKELEKILKELNKKNITCADLEILDEINYQSQYYLEIELNEEEKEKIFNKIHTAWLKTDTIPIFVLTTVVMENIKKLDKMTTNDIVEEAIWRY